MVGAGACCRHETAGTVCTMRATKIRGGQEVKCCVNPQTVSPNVVGRIRVLGTVTNFTRSVVYR